MTELLPSLPLASAPQTPLGFVADPIKDGSVLARWTKDCAMLLMVDGFLKKLWGLISGESRWTRPRLTHRTLHG